MTNLTSLVEKLEKAEGPDTELDARIWAHFAGVKYTGHNKPYGDVHGRTQVEFTVPPKRTSIVTNDGSFAKGPYRHAEPVTSSIDAAVSLAARVLPGWCMDADLLAPPPLPTKFIVRAYHQNGQWSAVRAECVSAPLAICLVTLRALQQKGSSNG
jgi:hypothetical protein